MTSAGWPGDRRPAAVPDDPDDAASERDADLGRTVYGGVDTDADGLPDTLLTDDGGDLLVLTDLDGDGLADRVLHIGPDGSVHADVGPYAPQPAPVGVPDDADDALPWHAPARAWGALLGHLFGRDP